MRRRGSARSTLARDARDARRLRQTWRPEGVGRRLRRRAPSASRRARAAATRAAGESARAGSATPIEPPGGRGRCGRAPGRAAAPRDRAVGAWRAKSASGRGSARAAERRSPGAVRARAGPPRAWRRARSWTLGGKLGAHRHRHLGGAGRRRRAHVGGEVDQRPVGLVADRRDERDRARRRGAHDDLLVEAPEILDRAAAARDDQHVRPRDRARPASALKPRIAAATSSAEVSPWTRTGQTRTWRGKRSSSRCRMSRITAPVGEVTTPIDPRQIGQRPLARGLEQALGRELAAALLEQRHQRADARPAPASRRRSGSSTCREGRDAPGGDHLEPFLRLEAQPREGRSSRSPRRCGRSRPSGRNSHGRRRCGPRKPEISPRTRTWPNGILERALQRAGELRDRPFGRVRGAFGLRNHGADPSAHGHDDAKRRRFVLLARHRAPSL